MTEALGQIWVKAQWTQSAFQGTKRVGWRDEMQWQKREKQFRVNTPRKKLTGKKYKAGGK